MTHPFHPWCGRTFELLERRTTWGEDRVYFSDDAGQLRRLPAAWTSAAVRSPFEVLAGGRSHFRVADLLQLVALMACLRAVQVPAASPGCQENNAASVKQKMPLSAPTRQRPNR